MALVKCPECGQEVSDSALDCPKCGKQLRKPKRGFFGKLFIWSFYLYNLLMVVWLIGGINSASKIEAVSEAEKAGAAIGTGIGITMILIVWVIGDIITGLLALMTRPKR